MNISGITFKQIPYSDINYSQDTNHSEPTAIFNDTSPNISLEEYEKEMSLENLEYLCEYDDGEEEVIKGMGNTEIEKRLDELEEKLKVQKKRRKELENEVFNLQKHVKNLENELGTMKLKMLFK